MKKDFDAWNTKKKTIDAKIIQITPFFREGEVWWVHLGINVGFEMDGKSDGFTRPVLVIKKYNQFSFLAIPLSTSLKMNRYRITVGIIDGKEAVANLSQMKNIDSKRLVRKICTLQKEVLQNIKTKTSQVNFG